MKTNLPGSPLGGTRLLHRRMRRFLAAAAILASSAGAACPMSGAGTETSPYLVATYADLLKVGVGDCGVAANYRLVSDIDASASEGTPFEPIGGSAGFEGRFHGAGHSISNLVVGSSGIPPAPFLGLFGVLGSQAFIDSLEMVSETIDGGLEMQTDSTASIGGIAGKSSGLVYLCKVKGKITGPLWYKIGGVVGYNKGRIESCASSAFVSTVDDSIRRNLVVTRAVDTLSAAVGGVAARNTGRINNSTNLGRVEGAIYAGGVVGRNDGDVMFCHSTGPIKGVGSSHWIVSTPGAAGGVVGMNGYNGWIRYSYAEGTVSASDNSAAGGVAGCNKGYLGDSYSHALVRGLNGSPAGGLVGIQSRASGVQRVYCDGKVDPDGTALSGGLMGTSVDSCNRCYWNGPASRQQQGFGNPGLMDGVMLTSEEMLHAAGFPELFWGERSVWRIDEGNATPTLVPAATNLVPSGTQGRAGSNGLDGMRAVRTRDGLALDLSESVKVRILDLSGRRLVPDRNLSVGRQDVSLAGIAGTVLVELTGASGRMVVPLVGTNR